MKIYYIIKRRVSKAPKEIWVPPFTGAQPQGDEDAGSAVPEGGNHHDHPEGEGHAVG
jgi:hypothetical protein